MIVAVLVAIILIFLAAHSLLVQVLRVHLIGDGTIALVVLVVGRTGIPPPVGIVKAAVRVGIVGAVAAGISEAVIAESVVVKVLTVESVMQKRLMEEAALRGRSVRKTARGASADVHSTGDVAASDVTAARARVPAETSGMSASAVTSAVLRPERQGQTEGERRDGQRTTHTRAL